MYTEFWLGLYDSGLVRFGSFRLNLHEQFPSAPLSPIYIDLRLLRRLNEGKNSLKGQAINIYKGLLRPLQYDLLADIPTAATPLVSSLSDELRVGMVTPRVKPKGHGTGAKVDGMLPEDKGKITVAIDDLITDGGSKLPPIEVLEEAGLIVNDVVVLVDREQGGREFLANKRYTLHSATTMTNLLDTYQLEGRITPTHRQEIVQGLDALTAFRRLQGI